MVVYSTDNAVITGFISHYTFILEQILVLLKTELWFYNDTTQQNTAVYLSVWAALNNAGLSFSKR